MNIDRGTLLWNPDTGLWGVTAIRAVRDIANQWSTEFELATDRVNVRSQVCASRVFNSIEAGKVTVLPSFAMPYLQNVPCPGCGGEFLIREEDAVWLGKRVVLCDNCGRSYCDGPNGQLWPLWNGQEWVAPESVELMQTWEGAE